MSEAKWTSESVDNNQLWIEAEAIVVGKFGIQPVYKTLQSIRDRTIATERDVSRITDAKLTGDLEMARDRLRELEQQLAWKEGLIRQLTEVDMPALEGQLATLQAADENVLHWVDVVTTAVLDRQDEWRPEVGIAASALVDWMLEQQKKGGE